MGKKMYSQSEVSKERTDELKIQDLLVLDSEGDDENFYTVHKRYFKKDKLLCPVCGSDKTRCSKVTRRKFKDVLWESEKKFKVIDLFFYQRYLRCGHCKDSVFPEDIEFAQKGSRYTNRLSDKLADGTFRYSYQKVCAYYSVPASTASVGAIMRRRIQYRESQLAPVKTPKTLCVVEAEFYGNAYPVVLGIWGDTVYCLDILESTDEGVYISFFRKLALDSVETICIDPKESLNNAAAACFPTANVIITGECVYRYARNAMINIIHSDGKRFPLIKKEAQLTQHKRHLTNERDKKQIRDGMKKRPRLKTAYDNYQKLLELLETKWTYEDLAGWVERLPDELLEFADLTDMISIYETEIRAYLDSEEYSIGNYIASVQAVCDAFKNMPKCIFDVLRARSIFTLNHDTIEENGEKARLGIRYDRLASNMNSISDNIKEEREYGLE